MNRHTSSIWLQVCHWLNLTEERTCGSLSTMFPLCRRFLYHTELHRDSHCFGWNQDRARANLFASVVWEKYPKRRRRKSYDQRRKSKLFDKRKKTTDEPRSFLDLDDNRCHSERCSSRESTFEFHLSDMYPLPWEAHRSDWYGKMPTGPNVETIQ